MVKCNTKCPQDIEILVYLPIFYFKNTILRTSELQHLTPSSPVPTPPPPRALIRINTVLYLVHLQWVQRVEKGQKDFENISATVRKEIARFDRLRVGDFKTSVIKYLEVLMDKQQQVLK